VNLPAAMNRSSPAGSGAVPNSWASAPAPAWVSVRGISRPRSSVSADRKIRLQLAELQKDMSIDQWVRVIASEPSGAFRRRFQALAVWHCPKVTEVEFERWARDPDPQIRLQALWFRGLPERLAVALAAGPDPEDAWPHLDAGRRSALVDDPSPQVQEVARQQADFDRPMSRTDFDALTTTGQWRMARSQLLDRDLAEHLVHHPDRGLRETLVANKRLDADLITVLAQDEDPQVRVTVAVRPDTTEALRAAISAGLSGHGHRHPDRADGSEAAAAVGRLRLLPGGRAIGCPP
jgi:hypothetical protein